MEVAGGSSGEIVLTGGEMVVTGGETMVAGGSLEEETGCRLDASSRIFISQYNTYNYYSNYN